MARDLIERERELYKSSFALRQLDLSKVDFKIAKEIRKKQDEDYHKHLFFRGVLEQLDKEKKKDE